MGNFNDNSFGHYYYINIYITYYNNAIPNLSTIF